MMYRESLSSYRAQSVILKFFSHHSSGLPINWHLRSMDLRRDLTTAIDVVKSILLDCFKHWFQRLEAWNTNSVDSGGEIR